MLYCVLSDDDENAQCVCDWYTCGRWRVNVCCHVTSEPVQFAVEQVIYMVDRAKHLIDSTLIEMTFIWNAIEVYVPYWVAKWC